LCQQYFPPDTFKGPVHFEDFTVKWYSAQLNALQEPSLWELSRASNAQVYRLLWLRTFHHPIAVRVSVESDGTGNLAVKIADGRGGYAPGKLIDNRILQLSKQHVRWFLDGIDALKYWELSVDDGPGGCDGAEWILEGVRNHGYRVVRRWSPTQGPIRTLGSMMLFEMAHLKVPLEEIY
jgi:hypothetical protein